MSSEKIKVFIIDNSSTFKTKLISILKKSNNLKFVGSASDALEAHHLLNEYVVYPDIILIDTKLPKMDGLTYLKRELSRLPLDVIVVTENSEQYLQDAKHSGASAMIDKVAVKLDKPNILIDAITSTFKKSRKKEHPKCKLKHTKHIYNIYIFVNGYLEWTYLVLCIEWFFIWYIFSFA